MTNAAEPTASESEGSVSVEGRGHLLLIGLNRPAKYNGLTPTMMDELVDAFTRLDDDPDLWVGVVFGHGDHFTAGLDLPKFTALMEQGTRSVDDVADAPPASTPRVDPFGLKRWCRKPIVTAVHGITYTAGLELMLAGDIAIAADNCRFSQLEPARAIHATGGATIRFVDRAGWGNAMYHLLTSDEFDSAEALRCGFVQEVVPLGRQLDRAIEIAERIAQGAPAAVQATKASSRRFVTEGHQAAIDALAPTQAELTKTADYAEGIASFVERRTADFTGR
ncbi:MAG: crotonase/enoyl-CoA hydratase family protein [Acidimicrobiales bacterium]|nr:crotonase/enoyl-CoA hydratase family protein [Acidimicrobiales bacterium]